VNWKIRPATTCDASILEEIERTCFSHDPWIAADFRKYRCLVAEFDSQIVGFLVGLEVYKGSAEQLREREILNVAVLPNHRRLGIGRALLEHELQEPAVYTLEVRESNLAAQQLYKGLGFAEIGKRPYYYQSPRENAIVMRLKRC
jgi:[ribosomal protein S18]-alanine N-acetyltransferase